MKHDELQDLTFHDATFLVADIRWTDGVVILKFRVHPQREVWIVAKSFLSIAVPRRFEWGASSSVNRIAWLEDGHAIDVEMQSGDTIQVAASEFTIEWPE